MLSIFFIFFLLFSCHLIPAEAQKRDSLATELAEITIESTYSNISLKNAPFAVSQLNRPADEIRQTPGLTLSELTRSIPGIWVNQRENFALGERITIRGMGWRAAFGVRGIQVLMDGIPLTVADGQSMLDVVDPAMIQSLEVLRGPASTLYGNSSGGVLYIKTVPPVQSSVSVKSQAGSFGLTKNQLQINQKLGEHFISGYTTLHNENGFRNHSATTLSRTAINSRWMLSNQSILNVNGALAVMPRAEHPGSLTREQLNRNPAMARPLFKENDAGKQVTQGQLGVRWLQTINGNNTLETNAYGIIRDLRNPLPFAFIDLDRKAGGFRSLIRHQSDSWQWAGGADLKFQFDERENFNTVDGERGSEVQLKQNERVLNEAIFMKASYQKGNWNISSGLRLDALQFNNDDLLLTNGDQSGDETFLSLNPSFGMTYSRHRQTFFTNFSTSFEAPTTTELVNNPENIGGFNPRINPEKTKSIEAGIRGEVSPARISYDLAFYTMWTDDLLLPFQIEGTDRTFFRNEGASRHNGMELVIRYRLFPGLSGLINYNWNNAEFTSGSLDGIALDSNNIPGVTPHRFFSKWSYKLKFLNLTGSVEFTDGYFPDSKNSIKVQSYTLLNLKAGIPNLSLSPTVKITPFFAIQNLTDKTFSSSISVNAAGNRFFEPGADLNVQAGLNILFK